MKKSMPNNTLLKANLPGLKRLTSGKVRDIFDVGKNLLIVATDRISAFDIVLPNGIPFKGKVLTGLSEFWFNFLKNVKHHLITTNFTKIASLIPEIRTRQNIELLKGRSMLVKKAKPFPVECVVRGYLAGSGWKDYIKTGSICGIKLPKGLKESQRLSEPIFTPATKAQTGHDENITIKKMQNIVGKEVADILIDKSISIYKTASNYALKKGIIISDTKFEFGEANGEILLIDEVLTPDSSRFWSLSKYEPGKSQPSFDKQFVRDYLEFINWNKKPPAPKLPKDIIKKTSEKYLEVYKLLVGKKCI